MHPLGLRRAMALRSKHKSHQKVPGVGLVTAAELPGATGRICRDVTRCGWPPGRAWSGLAAQLRCQAKISLGGRWPSWGLDDPRKALAWPPGGSGSWPWYKPVTRHLPPARPSPEFPPGWVDFNRASSLLSLFFPGPEGCQGARGPLSRTHGDVCPRRAELDRLWLMQPTPPGWRRSWVQRGLSRGLGGGRRRSSACVWRGQGKGAGVSLGCSTPPRDPRPSFQQPGSPSPRSPRCRLPRPRAAGLHPTALASPPRLCLSVLIRKTETPAVPTSGLQRVRSNPDRPGRDKELCSVCGYRPSGHSRLRRVTQGTHRRVPLRTPVPGRVAWGRSRAPVPAAAGAAT